ncbi:MAG: acyltransferase [Peptoniphilaceae bacterium]|uniref:acyltransferase n=1 Tax=Parvimonas sp. TaxID=1944660 RepID=UPI0025D314A3|nr:acyltransferase [Parvimonas sp.]MCI5996625.1 acyltransferase [Parvimonas sp.]MDD7765251.1 acyltransferase [Peptoniphilaceae bacterium]MDY3051333.1 acyltransferase [Parvimonas sp.]
MENKSERNYGIDLLRIVSMLMVVTLHVLGKGNLLYNENVEIFSMKYNILWILEIMSYCAVNCYALISGFVGVKSKFKYSNILILWLQVVFYTVTISFVFSKLGINYFSKTELIESFFPVLNSKYWYFTAYFSMFFLIPIFNSAINNIPEKQLRVIIFSLILVFSIFPTIYIADVFKISRGYHVLWLSILYLVGGYISKYQIKFNFKFDKIILLILYFVCVVITFFIKRYSDYMLINNIEFKFSLMEYVSPTILICSITLLLFFSKIKIRTKFLKNIIIFGGQLCFSIYLIHEHELVREYFIVDKFAYFLNFYSFDMILKIVYTVLEICLVCMFIDVFRWFLFRVLKLKKLFINIENFLLKINL